MGKSSEYDYVIIGAGSAGCVLAGRLSEDPSVRVLLVEAGGPDSRREVQIPAAWVTLLQSEADWNYWTAPQQQLEGRSIYWPRGKVLGGSSSINAQIYLRGDRLDFDEWKAQGNPGWGYDQVLPCFLKSEDNQRGAGPYHGVGGPLAVSDAADPNPLSQAFLESGLALGIPCNDDFNAERLDGIGYCQFTRKDGARCSASKAFLKPALHRPNLEVWTSCLVGRLLLDGKRVLGAECKGPDGWAKVRAGREVLLSAGAVNSPQILMLSGIGPRDHLGSLGIEAVHHLEGVGQNLQDHVVAPVRFLSKAPVSFLKAKSLGSLSRYILQKRGMLASSGVEVLAHLRTRPQLPAPDLQLLLMAILWLEEGLRRPSAHGFTIAPAMLKPKSRGWVRLQSDDPFQAPLIQPNYCSDPQGEDMRVLAEGIELGRRIAASAPFERLCGQEVGPGAGVRSAAEIEAYIRQNAQTYYHPVGTCRMGTDESAVVDPQLRVHGIEGLRVVDASIMPAVPRANTNAATIMIAEKASEMISGSKAPNGPRDFAQSRKERDQ